jgi:hypothetical protein
VSSRLIGKSRRTHAITSCKPEKEYAGSSAMPIVLGSASYGSRQERQAAKSAKNRRDELPAWRSWRLGVLALLARKNHDQSIEPAIQIIHEP